MRNWIVFFVGLMLIMGCTPSPPVDDGGSIEEPADGINVETTVTYWWTAPCVGPEPPCGSEPVEYVLEVHDTHGNVFTFTTTTSKPKIRVTFTTSGKVRARVAAADAAGNQGPWSNWSAWWPPQPDDLPDRREEIPDGRR